MTFKPSKPLLLTYQGWRKEIENSSLKKETKDLLIRALTARNRRKSIYGYPQIDPHRFEDIYLNEVDAVIIVTKKGEKILKLEQRMYVPQTNRRYLSFQLQKSPKKKA